MGERVEEQPKLFDIRFELEAMTPFELKIERERLLHELSECEVLIHAINDVLSGYGE